MGKHLIMGSSVSVKEQNEEERYLQLHGKFQIRHTFGLRTRANQLKDDKLIGPKTRLRRSAKRGVIYTGGGVAQNPYN